MSFSQEREKNIRKTWILITVFLVIIIGIGYYLSEIYQSPAILYAAVGFSFIQVLISYFLSKKIALKSSGAKEVKREEFPQLYNAVENLSRSARIAMPSVHIINDKVPNAFATGRNPKNAAVAVTTGLLQIMDKRELEGVIAHELSHIKNYDILISSVVVVLVGFLAIISRIFMFGGKRNDNGSAGIIFSLILIILAPIVGTIIQMAISRKREYLADASGAILSHNPAGLASALEKLGQYSGKMKKASTATSHMFISSSFGIKKNNMFGAFTRLFSTHPPMEERIKRLRYR